MSFETRLAFRGFADSCPRLVPINILYPVMALPPFELGGLHLSVTLFLPDVAFGLVGAVGTFRGVRVTGIEADPAPMLLAAVTVIE